MTPPNILLIIIDDLNSWIGCLGAHPDASTPNIDRLAKRGVLFSRAYCAAPYCNASRMSAFTGVPPHVSGIYGNEPYWEMEERAPTIFERFADAGYHCFGAGKVFHGVYDYATAGARAVWRDRFQRIELWREFAPAVDDVLPPRRALNGLFGPGDVKSAPAWRLTLDWGPLDDLLEREMPDTRAAAFATDIVSRSHEAPFLCALGLYKPHLPWHAPARFFERFRDAPPALPLVNRHDLDDAPAVARAWVARRPDHDEITRNGLWEAAVAAYLACVAYCDEKVGEVLAALDASPNAGNTIVLLVSDNGFHLGEKLHWRKFVLWEEATRVPMIFAGPGVDAVGRSCAAPVSLLDIGPTLTELCGLEAERWPSLSPGAGESLRRALANPGSFVRSAPVLSTWEPGNHSLRADKWRYTRYHDGAEELFNHETDPHEWRNLAGEANHGTDLAYFRPLVPAA